MDKDQATAKRIVIDGKKNKMKRSTVVCDNPMFAELTPFVQKMWDELPIEYVDDPNATTFSTALKWTYRLKMRSLWTFADNYFLLEPRPADEVRAERIAALKAELAELEGQNE